MLVILDPPGNVPIFLAVTQRLSEKERNRAAFLAIGTAFLVISLFAIGGQTILDYLNVSVPALQGAGGLLLLLVALQLLYGKGHESSYEVASPEQRTSMSFPPACFPKFLSSVILGRRLPSESPGPARYGFGRNGLHACRDLRGL